VVATVRSVFRSRANVIFYGAVAATTAAAVVSGLISGDSPLVLVALVQLPVWLRLSMTHAVVQGQTLELHGFFRVRKVPAEAIAWINPKTSSGQSARLLLRDGQILWLRCLGMGRTKQEEMAEGIANLLNVPLNAIPHLPGNRAGHPKRWGDPDTHPPPVA
jgi:hypothetical protein